MRNGGDVQPPHMAGPSEPMVPPGPRHDLLYANCELYSEA